jgi:hypothetical protein
MRLDAKFKYSSSHDTTLFLQLVHESQFVCGLDFTMHLVDSKSFAN